MGDKKEMIRLLTRQRDEAEARAAAEKQTRLNLAGALVDARRALATARQERDKASTALAAKVTLLGDARATIERLEVDLAEKVRELESKPTRVVIQAPGGAEVTFEPLPSAGSVWGGII